MPISGCSIVLVISFQDKILDLSISTNVSGKMTFSRLENNSIGIYYYFIAGFVKFEKVYLQF